MYLINFLYFQKFSFLRNRAKIMGMGLLAYPALLSKVFCTDPYQLCAANMSSKQYFNMYVLLLMNVSFAKSNNDGASLSYIA